MSLANTTIINILMIFFTRNIITKHKVVSFHPFVKKLLSQKKKPAISDYILVKAVLFLTGRYMEQTGFSKDILIRSSVFVTILTLLSNEFPLS